MAQTAIGVMLKRLFVRAEHVERTPDPETEIPDDTPKRHEGPPLVMLVPGVAGVSIYQMRTFDDAHSAAAFIEACNPYRIYKEGIIAFWSMHDKPPHDHDAECAVLVRTEPNSDLVHAYAFADLDAASAYVRFRIEETDEPLEAFVIHWAASIRIHANPTGEVRLEPSTPPIVARPMRPSPAVPEPLELPEEQAIVIPDQAREALVIEDVTVQPEMPAADFAPVVEPDPQEPVVARQAKDRAPELPEPTRTRWSRKAPRKVSPKVKAHVLALGLMGFGVRDIEGELRRMFPGDRVPTRTTISRWLKRAGISRANLKRWEQMSEHAMRILESRLAELAGAPLSEVARVASVLEGMRRK